MSARLSLCLVPLLALAACDRAREDSVVLAQPADSPESFGSVLPFSFTDQEGRTVTLESLRGHAWAACFVFTRCSGPCPRVSATMKALQSELHDPQVRLVSVSVDPLWDSSAVLASYAKALGAQPERWSFLTGDEATIDAWITQSFLSAVARDPAAPVGERVTHRTSISAVDKQGRVRGFYEGESTVELEKLRARLEWLQKQ